MAGRKGFLYDTKCKKMVCHMYGGADGDGGADGVGILDI